MRREAALRRQARGEKGKRSEAGRPERKKPCAGRFMISSSPASQRPIQVTGWPIAR